MVELWEAVLTFLFFPILLVVAYFADKRFKMQQQKLSESANLEGEVPVIEYSAYEIYKDLLVEQRGNAPQDEASVKKRDKMKRFIKQTMKTD